MMKKILTSINQKICHGNINICRCKYLGAEMQFFDRVKKQDNAQPEKKAAGSFPHK
jgi:hypothetical protein